MEEEWRLLVSMEILMRKIGEQITTIIYDVIGETYNKRRNRG
ncbi:hypothetical protein [Bacillus subtilis]|nr:hypothetical protein [Bacillus subtilis]